MSAAKKTQRPSLALMLEGLDLKLGAVDSTGKTAITREDGSLWMKGRAHEVSAVLLAAPATLEALRGALAELEGMRALYDADDLHSTFNRRLDAARAAIAKAEGRQP